MITVRIIDGCCLFHLNTTFCSLKINIKGVRLIIFRQNRLRGLKLSTANTPIKYFDISKRYNIEKYAILYL